MHRDINQTQLHYNQKKKAGHTVALVPGGQGQCPGESDIWAEEKSNVKTSKQQRPENVADFLI